VRVKNFGLITRSSSYSIVRKTVKEVVKWKPFKPCMVLAQSRDFKSEENIARFI
jgi:hypothetical protein